MTVPIGKGDAGTEHQHQTRIPVVVIGGFLGAGKTTLLNQVLMQNHGVRAGVLVNDFGSVNVDIDLVVDVEGETLSFANGCICCTIREDLAARCLELAQAPEPLDIVLIELSGVSDPAPVLNMFCNTQLGVLFDLRSVIVVVDAEQVMEVVADRASLINTQLKSADIVVLNKIDLVARSKVGVIRQHLQSQAPGAPIVEAIQGYVDMQIVLGAGVQHKRDFSDHLPAATHSQHPLRASSWLEEKPLSVAGLRCVLDNLPDSILRCKGYVHFEEFPSICFVLQLVGRRYDFAQAGRWEDNRPRTELVCISLGKAFDNTCMRKTFQQAIGCGDETNSPLLRLVRKIAPDLQDPIGTSGHSSVIAPDTPTVGEQ